MCMCVYVIYVSNSVYPPATWQREIRLQMTYQGADDYFPASYARLPEGASSPYQVSPRAPRALQSGQIVSVKIAASQKLE